MKISCTNGMIPGKTLTEKANILRECGFDAMSVFVDYAEWTPEQEDELLHLEEHTGIHVCEFCFGGDDYGWLMADEEKSRTARVLYKKSIEICNRLGAISEMEYLYQPQNPLPLFNPYQKMNAEQTERFCGIFRELAENVAPGSYLLLEPINRYEAPYLNSVEDNLEILEMTRLPNTGLLADIFHMSIEQKDICAALRKAAPWIRHVHLGDNNRLLPGNGCLDWKAIFRTLNDIGYAGYVNLECGFATDRHVEELKASARFLRDRIDGK